MAIPRRRTLQDLLSSIGSGAAPVDSGNVNSQRAATPMRNVPLTAGARGGMSSPYMPPKYPSVPGYGGEQNPFISKPSPILPGKVPQDYSPSPLDPYQAKLEEDRLGAIDPTKPYGPQGDPFQPNQTVLKDVVPTYQDVNPFIWDQRTGQPSKTYFNEYIQLLTDRHPNFATEYKANPQAALSKYESESGLYGDLNVAQDYHYGIDPMSGGPMRDTPQFQMMLLNTPAMIDQNIRDYGIDAVYGPLVRPNTITTESSLAGMGGLLDPDVAANNGGGILGTV